MLLRDMLLPMSHLNQLETDIPQLYLSNLSNQLMVKIVIAVGNDAIWKRFCSVSDLDTIVDDERFAINPKRNENYDVLRPLIAEKIKLKRLQSGKTFLMTMVYLTGRLIQLIWSWKMSR